MLNLWLVAAVVATAGLSVTSEHLSIISYSDKSMCSLAACSSLSG